MATLDAHGVEIVRWPIKHCGAVDLVLVDRVARVHLVARRTGRRVTLRHTAPELVELLELVGLLELAGREPSATPPSEVLG